MTARDTDPKLELLQGTLDMMILKTLVFGPTHGRGIGNRIRETTLDALSVEHGSLYPALHRLERAGLIAGTWEQREASKRELKYYRLTPKGRKQLHREESRWNRLVEAITRVMRPVEA